MTAPPGNAAWPRQGQGAFLFAFAFLALGDGVKEALGEGGTLEAYSATASLALRPHAINISDADPVAPVECDGPFRVILGFSPLGAELCGKLSDIGDLVPVLGSAKLADRLAP